MPPTRRGERLPPGKGSSPGGRRWWPGDAPIGGTSAPRLAIEGLLAKANKPFGTISNPEAFCKGPTAWAGRPAVTTGAKARLAAHQEATEKLRAQRDAQLRRQGHQVERNVRGRLTSKRIWDAQPRSGKGK